MQDLLPAPELSDSGRELQHAAGVGRDNPLCAGGIHRIHLFAKQRERHTRIHYVIYASTSAA